MTLLSYRVHQAVAVVFLAALLLSGADYVFKLGFFGSTAKPVAGVILLLLVIYAGFFAPARQEMQEYLDVKRAAKGSHRNHGD